MTPYRSAVASRDFHPDTRAFFAGKSVLVTGGAGFVGSHVVEQILSLGAKTVVPSRAGKTPFLAHLGESVKIVACDLADGAQARAVSAGADIIMHLAADIGGLSYNIEHPASIFDANMRLGMNILAAAAFHRVSRTLLCSSACVYPRHCSVPTPEAEGFKDQPEPSNAGYGWSKRMLEFLGAQYAREFGLSIAIARPYNAYGPRDQFDPRRSHVIPALIRKAIESRAGTFEVWGDGRASRSFIYIDDLARGVIEIAARHPNADAVNIGTDEEITIADLAGLVADLIGAKTGTRPRPVFRPESPTGQPRRKCATTKARRVLDFEARIPLAKGLEKTIDWYIRP